MENEKIINEGGIQGTGEGLVNLNSREFKVLQQLIEQKSGRLEPSEIIKNRILSLRFQMESYLNKENPSKIISAGAFLKALVEAIGIKQKTFAEYLDYQESNMSAIFSGRRKINTELALKLGEIFEIDPVLLLNIQNKNELLKVNKTDRKAYKKYKLEDLLER